MITGLRYLEKGVKLTSIDGCPPITWHILEVVINALMVIEVGTRWIAYGKVCNIFSSMTLSNMAVLIVKKYPMTPLNVIDLLLVLFCSITLIVVFTSPCSDGSMCTYEAPH